MSEIKVNKISPRTACGTTTLGDSGDTFTIPAGATINNQGTAVNFGATGSASWVTTVKTTDFTAVAGEGYFVNTTSGEIDVTLPASPSAGAVVAIKDYANTWDTNNCILLRNGSNIGGNALNSTLSIEGLAVTLVYVDATKGWLVTDSGLQNEAPGPEYVTATGGTITCSGNFRIHTFTGPGTFCVSAVGNSAGSTLVDYLVVGSGAAGGCNGGGGGAGGFRESPGTASGSYSVSPLGAAPAVSLPVSITGYPVTVGGGGTSSSPHESPAPGRSGNVSIFSSITSAGGGGGGASGGSLPTVMYIGAAGGSGGGGSAPFPPPGPAAGGAGNTPPVSPAQGFPGGGGYHQGCVYYSGGGGGGATAVGGTGGCGSSAGPTRPGGAGATTSITGSAVGYAGGGNAGGCAPLRNPTPVGFGAGGYGSAGTANTGGGGGASNNAGGSGIVVIRYKFQN